MLVTQRVAAFHVAYLDLATGVGMLVLPEPRQDVWLGPHSLHGADWDAAMKALDRLGWEPLTDEDDLPIVEGVTSNGCEVIALYGRDPLVSMPSLAELAASGAALKLAVLTPD